MYIQYFYILVNQALFLDVYKKLKAFFSQKLKVSEFFCKIFSKLRKRRNFFLLKYVGEHLPKYLLLFLPIQC